MQSGKSAVAATLIDLPDKMPSIHYNQVPTPLEVLVPQVASYLCCWSVGQQQPTTMGWENGVLGRGS